MCGINGLGFKDEALVKRMNKVCSHRGPDDTGKFSNKHITLGHNRLSILDLSKAGHQPMSYEHDGRKVIITYNGEIYNFREVREELENKGYDFKSETDTEVILAAYLEYGYDCLEKFKGMWAFCIYDEEENKLFLAVDRFAKKPLYYHNKDKFLFSSEIKSILQHDGVERKANKTALANYLYHQLTHHDETTFFKDIHRLQAGHYLVYDLNNKELKKKKYFDFKHGDEDKQSFSKSLKKLDTNLKKSLHYRLVSDVPVSISLSGGIDSSTIAGIIGKETDTDMRAFSLKFESEETKDELKLVNKLVKKYSLFKLNPVEVEEDTLAEHAEKVIWHQEEPIVGTGAFVRYLIARDVNKQDLKVLLTGEGGDEAFSGYTFSYSVYLYHTLKKLQVWKFIKQYSKMKRKGEILKGILFLMLPRFAKKFVMKKRSKKFRKKFNIKIEDTVENKLSLYDAKDFNQYLYNTLKRGILPRLLNYNDKMAMAHSVESRSPILDSDVVQLSMELSKDKKVKDGYSKYILRKTGNKYVPNSIIWNREKTAFPSPIKKMLKAKQFQELVKDYFEDQKSSEVFDGEKYIENYQDFLDDKNCSIDFILKGFWIEAWYRAFDIK